MSGEYALKLPCWDNSRLKFGYDWPSSFRGDDVSRIIPKIMDLSGICNGEFICQSMISWMRQTKIYLSKPCNLKLCYFLMTSYTATGLGGSVGCAVRLETRRSRVKPPPRSATFFRGDWSWNIFYGHSLPSADSRRAVVSFWRKNVHNTG